MSEEIKREKSSMELWAENEVKIACHRKGANSIMVVPAMKAH